MVLLSGVLQIVRLILDGDQENLLVYGIAALNVNRRMLDLLMDLLVKL